MENFKCYVDEELQEADTWLLESQAIVEELICRTVEYREVKTHTTGIDSNANIEPEPPKTRTERTDDSSIISDGLRSKKSGSKTSSTSRERARAAAREADLAKLKVKQLKEKAELEAKIAAQKAQLEAELAIQEAEHEAGRKEIEALLLNEEQDYLSNRMKDFEDSLTGNNVNIETTPQIKQEDGPRNDVKVSTQKVKEWLKTVRPKEEQIDEKKESDYIPKRSSRKETALDFSQPFLSKSALITSLPKLNLPVFDGDPCAWPNWYGMFKALVHDQKLSKTQKMIYLKASVKKLRKKP